MSDVLRTQPFTDEDIEPRAGQAAPATESQPALSLPAVRQLNRPVRIGGQDWTLDRITAAQRLPAPTDFDTVYERSRFFNDDTVRAFRDEEASDQEYNLAANRLAFRRGMAARGRSAAEINATTIVNWADERFPPQRFPDGRVVRDPRAIDLARQLQGEPRSNYWRFADAVPNEAAYMRAFSRELRDNTEVAAQYQAAQQAIRAATAPAPAERPPEGVGLLGGARNLGVNVLAGAAQGVVNLGGLAAQGAEAVGIPGAGTARDIVEGAGRVVEAGRRLGQTEAGNRNEDAFNAALSRIDDAAAAEIFGALSRGDTTAAAAAARRSGIGDAWDALPTSTLLNMVANSLGQIVAPGAAAARLAGLIRGTGRGAQIARGGVVVGGTGAAEAAGQAAELRQELIAAGVAPERASDIATTFSTEGGMATVANSLGNIVPLAALGRFTRFFPAGTPLADGVLGTGNIASRVARGAVAGGATGAVEEAGATAAFNPARQEGGLAPDSVAAAGLTGALVGTVMGAAGGVPRAPARPTPETPPAPQEQNFPRAPDTPEGLTDFLTAQRTEAQATLAGLINTPGAERDAAIARMTALNEADRLRQEFERTDAELEAARSQATTNPSTENLQAFQTAEAARNTALAAFQQALAPTPSTAPGTQGELALPEPVPPSPVDVLRRAPVAVDTTDPTTVEDPRQGALDFTPLAPRPRPVLELTPPPEELPNEATPTAQPDTGTIPAPTQGVLEYGDLDLFGRRMDPPPAENEPATPDEGRIEDPRQGALNDGSVEGLIESNMLDTPSPTAAQRRLANFTPTFQGVSVGVLDNEPPQQAARRWAALDALAGPEGAGVRETARRVAQRRTAEEEARERVLEGEAGRPVPPWTAAQSTPALREARLNEIRRRERAEEIGLLRRALVRYDALIERDVVPISQALDEAIARRDRQDDVLAAAAAIWEERDRRTTPPSRANPFDVQISADGVTPADVLAQRSEAAGRPGAIAGNVLDTTPARPGVAPPGQLTTDTRDQRAALDREIWSQLSPQMRVIAALLATRGQSQAETDAAVARAVKAPRKGAKAKPPTIYKRVGGTPPATPLTVAQVQAVIRGNPALKNLPVPITVVADMASAPPAVQAAFAGNPTTRGMYIHTAGSPPQVVINAAAHGSAADVQATINHEVLGHYGFSLFNGSGLYSDLLTRIAAEASSPKGDPRIRAAWAEARDAYPGVDDATIAAEVLARIAENPGAQPKGLVTRILALLRRMLATLGIGAGGRPLTYDALQQLVVSLRDFGEGKISYQGFTTRLEGVANQTGVQGMERAVGGIQQGWADKASQMMLDTRVPLMRMGQVADSLGITNTLYSRIKRVGNLVGTATAKARGMYQGPLEDGIRRTALELGVSEGQIEKALDNFAVWTHAAERNERLWLLNVPLASDDAMQARKDLVNAAVNSGQRWSEFAPALRDIVTQGTPGIPEAQAAYAGITTEQANANLAAMADDPLMVAAQRLYPLLRAATDESGRLQVAAGLRDQRVLRFFDYKNYVPLRGGKADDADVFLTKIQNVDERGLDQLGLRPDAGGRGLDNPAKDITRTVLFDLNGAAAHSARNTMFQEIARVALAIRRDATGKSTRFADVVSTTALSWDGKPGSDFKPVPDKDAGNLVRPDQYSNVFTFRDESGNSTFLAIVDPEVSAVLNEMMVPEPRTWAARAAAGMGSLYTRFNPEYWLRGTMRDYLNDIATLAMGYSGLDPSQRVKAIIEYNKSFGRALMSGVPWQLAKANQTRRAELLADAQFEGVPRFREFLDSGALGRFSDQFRDARDTLLNAPRFNSPNVREQVQAAAEAASRYFGAIPEIMEATHRYAFYNALRSAGQSIEDAAARTVDLTDFHQKSRMSSWLSNFYPFANVTAAGFSRWMTQEIFKNGQPPRAFTRTPDGQLRMVLSPSDIARAMAPIPTMAALVIGYASMQGSDDLLGKDENGRSYFSMLSPRTLGGNLFAPNPSGDREQPVRIPLPQTAVGYLVGIGQLFAAYERGYIDNGQLQGAAFSSFTQLVAPPGVSRVQFSDLPGGAATRVEDLVSNFAPEFVAPLVNSLALGRTGTGQRIDRTGDTASVEGARVTLSGRAAGTLGVGEMWNDVAQYIDETLGVSISPNRIREIANGYLGYPMRAVDRLSTADARARQSADPETAGDFVRDIIGRALIPQDTSIRSYRLREAQAAREPFQQPLQTYVMLAEADRRDPATQRTGARLERGTRVEAFLAENPALEDFLARNSARIREDRLAANGGSLWSRFQRAVEADDLPTAVRLRAELDARAAEDAAYQRKLWQAQTLLRAGTVSSWSAARIQVGLPAISEDRPLRGRTPPQ